MGRVCHPHHCQQGGEGVDRHRAVDHFQGADVADLETVNVGDHVDPGDTGGAGHLDEVVTLHNYVELLEVWEEGGTEEFIAGLEGDNDGMVLIAW